MALVKQSDLSAWINDSGVSDPVELARLESAAVTWWEHQSHRPMLAAARAEVIYRAGYYLDPDTRTGVEIDPRILVLPYPITDYTISANNPAVDSVDTRDDLVSSWSNLASGWNVEWDEKLETHTLVRTGGAVWPTLPNRVRVTYQGGWDADNATTLASHPPGDISQEVRTLVSWWLATRFNVSSAVNAPPILDKEEGVPWHVLEAVRHHLNRNMAEPPAPPPVERSVRSR